MDCAHCNTGKSRQESYQLARECQGETCQPRLHPTPPKAVVSMVTVVLGSSASWCSLLTHAQCHAKLAPSLQVAKECVWNRYDTALLPSRQNLCLLGNGHCGQNLNSVTHSRIILNVNVHNHDQKQDQGVEEQQETGKNSQSCNTNGQRDNMYI